MAPGRTMLRRFGPSLLALVIVVTNASCGSNADGISTTSADGSQPGAVAADETIDDGVSSYEDPPPEEAPPAMEAGPGTPMQTAADVNELLASWEQSGPRDYHYTAHLFVLNMSADGELDAISECGSRGGTVAVQVVGGEVFEGQVPESACVIDLGSPTRLPLTAEELFERTLELMVGDSFGARVEVNEVGFPTSIFTESRVGVIEFSLKKFAEGSGAAEVAADELARLKRARARWENARPQNYFIEVDRVCRCAPPYRGRFEVRVAGTDAIATVEGAELPEDLDAASFTVDGLFDAIEGWTDADRLQVIYDAERGIPIRIDVDPTAGTADDEVTLSVTRFLSDAETNTDLTTVLGNSGAAVDDAPTDAVVLGDATFCGFDDVSLNDEPIGGDAISRACFTSRANRSEPAVLVRRFPTVEGDPIIRVLRAGANGSLLQYTDSTQDSFGSGGWRADECMQVEDRSDIGRNFFTLRC